MILEREERSGALGSRLGAHHAGMDMPKGRIGRSMTPRLHRAVHYLNERGGHGIRTKNADLLVQGDIAPFSFDAWMRLIGLRLVKRSGQMFDLTDDGRKYCADYPLLPSSIDPPHCGRVMPCPGAE